MPPLSSNPSDDPMFFLPLYEVDPTVFTTQYSEIKNYPQPLAC